MKSALLLSVPFMSAAAFASGPVLCRVSKFETDKQLFLGRLWGTHYLVISPNDEVELQSIGAMKSAGDGTISVSATLEEQEIHLYVSKLNLVNGYPRSDEGTEATGSQHGVLSVNLVPRGIKISCKTTF